MKKINYLLAGISAITIVFASCSSQPKYTAFGGGWGNEKTKEFQLKKSEVKSNIPETISDQQTMVESELISTTQNTDVSKLENIAKKKISNKNTEKYVGNLTNKKIKPIEKLSWRKPSTWRASNLFSKADKTNSGGGSDTPAWGIAAIACSFLGLFILGILFGILGIIFGAIGLNKSLKGLAIAGLILGVIDVVVFFIFLAMFL